MSSNKNHYVRKYKDNIIIDKDVAIKIREYYKLQKEVEPILKDVKQELLDTMKSCDKKNVVSNGIGATYIDSYTRNTIDNNLLKTEYNDIYNKVCKDVVINPQVKLNVGE